VLLLVALMLLAALLLAPQGAQGLSRPAVVSRRLALGGMHAV
jgi:hypothetical protein